MLIVRQLISKAIAWTAAAVFWLVEPFWRIRITHVWCARLGELSLSMHIYMARRSITGPEKRTSRLFIGANPCNRQLFEMIKRRVRIVESRALSALYHYAGDGPKKLPFFATVDSGYEHRLLDQAGAVLRFTDEEEARGKDVLASLGLGPRDWFVCFQARDPSFHMARIGARDNKAHRTCRIENYLKAARLIAERGGFAIRVGATAAQPLPAIHPRVIDYTMTARSDFADIYLLGKCRFLLGSATGTADVPRLFHVPVAIANLLPLSPNPWGPHSMAIPKLMVDPASGEYVPFATLAKMHAFSYQPAHRNLWDSETHYECLGWQVTDNGEDDILDLCLDMLDRIEGRTPDAEAARLQRLYKERFFGEVPDFYRFGPDIGARFALRYRHLIES